MKLQEMEARRRAEIRAQRVEQKRKREEEERREQAILEQAKPLVAEGLAATEGVDVDDLIEVVWFGADCRDHNLIKVDGLSLPLPKSGQVILRVPEHKDIETAVELVEFEATWSYRRTYDHYHVDGVKRHSQYWRKLDSLADALIVAADKWQLEEEALQRDRVWEAEKEAMIAEQGFQEQEEREQLLAALSPDSVALSLLKVFLAIQEERRGYAASIEGLEWALGRVEEKAAQRVESLEREAASAKDEARDYQDRAWEAEDQVKKLERKRQGW